MDARVMNFKLYSSGAMAGFFDLSVGGNCGHRLQGFLQGG